MHPRETMVRSCAVSLAVASVLLGCGHGDPSGGPDSGARADSAMADASAPPDGAPDDAPDDAIDAAVDASPGGPSVIATTPMPDATGVERRTSIGATFSADMASGTIGREAFVVTCDGAGIAGAVRLDAATRTATFQPDVDLPLLGACTATITTAATDVDGSPLAAPHAWSFRVREGSWSGAELVEAGGVHAERVGVDAAGRATVVWLEDGGVWASRFLAGTGWQTPKRLGEDARVAADVAVGPAGDAVAVWLAANAVDRTDVWASRFVPGAGWQAATILDSSREDEAAHDPRVTIDPAGNAVVVWAQDDTTPTTNIWANRFVPGVGWSGAVQLESHSGRAFAPRIAVDASGRAVAVWSQHDVDRPRVSEIWANRFVPGVGWSDATRLGTADGFAYDHQVAVDPEGDAVVVWAVLADELTDLWTNRFAAGWGMDSLLEDADTSAPTPDVAIDAAGNAIAVWVQADGPRARVWARRFEPRAGWSARVRVEDVDVGRAVAPRVAMSPGGAATVVWSQWEGPIIDAPTATSLWTTRFVPGVGWGGARRLDTEDSAGSEGRVAVGPSGDVVAVWSRYPGLWANVFR